MRVKNKKMGGCDDDGGVGGGTTFAFNTHIGTLAQILSILDKISMEIPF